MKKIISAMIITLVIMAGTLYSVPAAESMNTVGKAINEYKEGNYLGCISDLKIYTEDNEKNAVAWYYLGSAYMKIAMKTDAHSAFDKVIKLNTVPQLTSYSIQAKMCMENQNKCNYQDFTYDQIQQLKEDPSGFMEQYFAMQNKTVTKSQSTIEIEKLIKGSYGNNIHPDARTFINEQKAKTKQSEINQNKA